MDTIGTLSEHGDLFTSNNPIFYLLRLLGWGIVWLLQTIINAMEVAYSTLLDNLTFYKADEMMGLFNSVSAVSWALLVIGILILAYKLMFNKGSSKTQIPTNLLAFVLIVTSLPTFMNMLAELTQTSVDTFGFDSSQTSVSQQIISRCVEDLLYYDQNDFSAEALEQKNLIAEDKTQSLNPIEIIKPDKSRNKEVFSNRLTVDYNGEDTLEKLDGGFFDWDMFSSYYYRFNIDWLTLLIALIAMVFALIFSSLKVAKLIFELGFNSIFLLFVAPLDLSVGQRMKKTVMEIINIFCVIICMCLIFRIYIYGIGWASATFEGLTLAVALLGFSWGLIDGPNIVQKILGIDAGLSSGGTFLSQLYHGGKMAKDVVGNVVSAPKKAMDSAKNTINSAKTGIGNNAGKIGGIYEHYKGEKATDNASKQGVYGFNRSNIHDDENAISTTEQYKLPTQEDKAKSDTQNNNPPSDSNINGTIKDDLNTDDISNKNAYDELINEDKPQKGIQNNPPQEENENRNIHDDIPHENKIPFIDDNKNQSENNKEQASSTINADKKSTQGKTGQEKKEKQATPDIDFNAHSSSQTSPSQPKADTNQTLGGYAKDKIKNSIVGKTYDISKNKTMGNIEKRHEEIKSFSNATKNSLNNANQKVNDYMDNLNSPNLYTAPKEHDNAKSPDLTKKQLPKPKLFKRKGRK